MEESVNEQGEFTGLLGERCERAGDLDKAADWYLLAGMHAFRQGALNKARSFYTRALALLPPDDLERRLQALLGREDVLRLLDEADPWQADIASLLELSRVFNRDDRLAEVFYRQAYFYGLADRRAARDEACQNALAAARRCKNQALEAKVLSLTAMNSSIGSNPYDAVREIEATLNLARRTGDEDVLSVVLVRAAICYYKVRNISRFYELCQEAVELDHHRGDRPREAIGLNNIGAHFIHLGLYRQALPFLEQAHAMSEPMGLHSLLATILMNLGEIALASGDLPKAHDYAEQAGLELSLTSDILERCQQMDLLGQVMLEMGDSVSAERFFLEVQELAKRQPLTPIVHEMSALLAACAVGQGKVDEARRPAHQTWEYLTVHGSLEMIHPERIYLVCAKTFEALGDKKLFQAAIERGYQAILKVANTIDITEWRQSYLENVPGNHALIELWERRML